MIGRFRALSALVLVVVLAAIAGTAYLGYHRGLEAGVDRNGLDIASTGDVHQLFASGQSDNTLLSMALDRLEARFYKPVNPQTPITGEVVALRAYLKKHHVAHPDLPNEIATGNAAQDAANLTIVLKSAQHRYDRKLGPGAKTDLTEAALSGMLASVHDRWTLYLSPHEIAGLTESLSGGNFGGIGVYIEQLKNLQVVVVPIAGMPAARSGLKPGDVVDAIDGVSTHGLTLDRVEQLIRGPAGSVVHIRAHLFEPKSAKQSPQRNYAIVRAIIHVPTVSKKMEGNIDYIRLSDFGETSAQEIRNALLFGKAHRAKGYILDLRNNGGGLVNAAVDISSFFIAHGPIVSTIRRDGSKTTEEANGDAISGLQPLVVLVNGYTASASEITSGALQDYHLATIIGTTTFGKGVVQSIYPMPDAGALKITTARYVTPLGRDIQHRGIMPDIVVPQSPDPMLIDTPADKQLAAAKARLRELIR